MMGRRGILSLANMAVGAVLGLVATFLTARYFGAAYSGQVDFALGIIGLLFFVTDLGMGQAHVKRVSEGRDAGDCFATFAVFKAVSTFVFVALVLGGLAWYGLVLDKPFTSTSVPILLTVLVYYVAKSAQEVAQSTFDARLEAARSQLGIFVDTFVRVVLTALGAALVTALVYNVGPLLRFIDPGSPLFAWMAANPGVILAIAVAGGGVAAAATSLALMLRTLERGRFRMDLLKDYATFALPLFLTSAVGMISAHVDSTALGFFLGDVDAGLFGRVRRLPLFLSGIGLAVSALLFPSLSAMVARDDRAGIQAAMDRSVRYLSLLLVPLILFLIVFAVPIIRIVLSNEFVAGATAMSLLAVYTYFVSVAVPHSNLLLGMGRSRVVAILGGITAILVIGLDLLLIPRDVRSLGIPLAGLGVEGAALGTLASGAFWYFSLRYASWRLAGYRERAHVWKHLLAGLVMAVALLALHSQLLPLTRAYHLPLYGLLGGLAYVGALMALRELHREDWDYVRESIHPGEMLRYVRGELWRRKK